MEDIKNMLHAISDDIKVVKTQLNKLTQSQTVKEEKWLDTQEVLLKLHISKRNLDNLRSKKLLPHSRINNKFYYKAIDIEEYLKKHYNGVIHE